MVCGLSLMLSTLRESVLVLADAHAVWPYVADPVLMSMWNPKIVAVDRAATGPVKPGEAFEMIYTMSGEERPTRVQVVECQPPMAVRFEHRMTWKSREQMMTERYDVQPGGGGVKVTKTIDLSRSGIPWPFRVLIVLLYRFGRSMETPYLQKMKQLVEEGGSDSPDAH